MCIRSARTYQLALRRGQRRAGRYFRCHWIPKEAVQSRLGLVVSRRVGTAVERNRVKRVIREVFRGTYRPVGTDDCVVVILPAAGRAPAQMLREELTRLLQSGKRASA